MWSDNSHGQSFLHTQSYSHSPGIDRLCLQSRLGCVLAGGSRGNARTIMGRNVQIPDTSALPSASQVSSEAAIFVAVIVVFYAAIIVILLGTNMRRSSTPSHRPRRSRSRSRSRSRPRHQLVLDPRSGEVSTAHVSSKKKKKKKKKNQSGESVGPMGAENV